MLLTSANGDHVDLRIAGYQFAKSPAASADRWDENSLTISGRVNRGAESWAFRDPCLTTWEAQELLEWLRSVAAGMQPERIYFTEPNLTFETAPGDGQGARLLVTLRGAAAPLNTSEDIRWGAGCRLILDMPLNALADVASAWEREVTAYPSR